MRKEQNYNFVPSLLPLQIIVHLRYAGYGMNIIVPFIKMPFSKHLKKAISFGIYNK